MRTRVLVSVSYVPQEDAARLHCHRQVVGGHVDHTAPAAAVEGRVVQRLRVAWKIDSLLMTARIVSG